MTGTTGEQAARIEAAAAELKGLALRDEPIGPKTTYRTGGAAALYVEISGPAALEAVARAVATSGVAVLALGRGSNLLVADSGFAGLCVALAGDYAGLELRDDGLARAGAGVDYPVLARRSAVAGWTGMEWAVGIPGSVGGAVAMNAGGHGAETKDRLVGALVVDLRTGEAAEWSSSALAFSYRHSALHAHHLVLSATYQLAAGDPERAAGAISEIVAWRRAHQPGGRNAGSTFSNPPGDSAGRLIEAAGLKGLRVGSAQVSEKHANFVQSDTNGSADDVFRLISEVRRLVLERLGVELSLELRTVGEFR
ncbi:MAG: UDP-N-acetylmuramate dehydrogenase [Actinomycetota bacterium]|nr:UDP-N-acetylmuramate dehydrogenase [Actinomycetota bacterium]